MKTKISIFVILFLGNLLFCHAQYQGTATIYTPCGKPVIVDIYKEWMSTSDLQSITNGYIGLYPGATVESIASNTYNGHGYAWVKKDGGIECRLYDGQLVNFWNDGCYLKTDATNAEKIHYYMSDELSAVKSSVSGKYISKWGIGPLMQHDPENGPIVYNMSFRDYYRRAPKIICCAGSSCSTVCCDGTCFKLEYTPSSTITWTLSAGSPFSFNTSSSVMSTTGSSVTVYRKNTGSGSGTLSASVGGTVFHSITITACTLSTPVISGSSLFCSSSEIGFSATNWNNCYSWDKSSNLSWGTKNVITNSSIDVQPFNSSVSSAGWVRVMAGSTIMAEYPVWVGKPSFYIYLDPHYVYSNEMTIANMMYNSSTYITQGITQVDWLAISGGKIGVGSSVTNAKIIALYLPPGQEYLDGCVEAKAYNACGNTTEYGYFYVYHDYSPKISPNPVHDILTIEINTRSITNEQLQTPITFYIHLYDSHGNLLRQTTSKRGNTEFNVSALPNGIYFLHVYNGISKTPEIHQVVIEH